MNFKICLNISIGLIVLLNSFFASGQNQTKDSFEEAEYFRSSEGLWSGYYAETFTNKYDSTRKIRIIYGDSTKDRGIYFKIFFTGDMMNGPYYAYSAGKIFMKGFMKNDKRDGEWLTYTTDSILEEHALYKEGKKCGTWEVYNSYGELSSKTYYDQTGKFIKREIFDRSGKLARTDLEEKSY